MELYLASHLETFLNKSVPKPLTTSYFNSGPFRGQVCFYRTITLLP